MGKTLQQQAINNRNNNHIIESTERKEIFESRRFKSHLHLPVRLLELLLFLHRAQDVLEQKGILVEHQIEGNNQSSHIKMKNVSAK